MAFSKCVALALVAFANPAEGVGVRQGMFSGGGRYVEKKASEGVRQGPVKTVLEGAGNIVGGVGQVLGGAVKGVYETVAYKLNPFRSTGGRKNKQWLELMETWKLWHRAGAKSVWKNMIGGYNTNERRFMKQQKDGEQWPVVYETDFSWGFGEMLDRLYAEADKRVYKEIYNWAGAPRGDHMDQPLDIQSKASTYESWRRMLLVNDYDDTKDRAFSAQAFVRPLLFEGVTTEPKPDGPQFLRNSDEYAVNAMDSVHRSTRAHYINFSDGDATVKEWHLQTINQILYDIDTLGESQLNTLFNDHTCHLERTAEGYLNLVCAVSAPPSSPSVGAAQAQAPVYYTSRIVVAGKEGERGEELTQPCDGSDAEPICSHTSNTDKIKFSAHAKALLAAGNLKHVQNILDVRKAMYRLKAAQLMAAKEIKPDRLFAIIMYGHRCRTEENIYGHGKGKPFFGDTGLNVSKKQIIEASTPAVVYAPTIQPTQSGASQVNAPGSVPIPDPSLSPLLGASQQAANGAAPARMVSLPLSLTV